MHLLELIPTFNQKNTGALMMKLQYLSSPSDREQNDLFTLLSLKS